MFNIVREKKRIVQFVLVLIVLPFALWGVNSYDNSANTVEIIATVNGSKVSSQEFENALRRQQTRMQEQLGSSYDAAMFDNPEVRRSLLDGLVTQHLLVERAKSERLAVTNDQLAAVISNVESFQVDGKFDKKQYSELLAANNLNSKIYEARLRDELLGQRMQSSFTLNGFAPNSVADNIFRLNVQQRKVSIASVDAQEFLSQAKVDEAALQQYYGLNQSEFNVPEQVKVEYVRLALDDLLAKQEVSEAETRQYYTDHQNEFATPEERQAAHILINVAASATQAERDIAKDKIELLLQQLNKNPEKFAELAKQNSQDTGSASAGGDLGYFGRGMMVQQFEDTAYRLKVGEISSVVQSDFGYHIIKLLAIKASKIVDFGVAREGIVGTIRQRKASDRFAELAEKFSNTVYEQSDTLKSAADIAGTKIEQSKWLFKGQESVTPWTPNMLKAIFSDEVTKKKRNTTAVEVATNVLVSARMLEYKPAYVRSLDEVKEGVRQKLLKQQALDLAITQGKILLVKLQQGGKATLKWGAVQNISRQKTAELDSALVRQIFQANTAKLPQYVGIEDKQNGYLLARIDAVDEGEVIDDLLRERYAQQLRQVTGEEMFQAYLADAKQHAEITMTLPEKAPE